MIRSFDHLRRIAYLALSLASAIILTTGCRSLSLAVAQPTQSITTEPPPNSDLEENEGLAKNNLKALESFLARTETYSLSPAGESAPTPEDSQRKDSVEPSPPRAHRQQTSLPPSENPALQASTVLPRVVFANIVEPPPSTSATPRANGTLALATRSAQRSPSAAPVVTLISIRDTIRDDEVMSASRPTIRVNQPGQGSNNATSVTMDDLLDQLVERAVNSEDVSAAWEAGLIHAALQKPLDAGSLSHALSHSLKPLFLTTIDLVRSLRKLVEDNPADVGNTLDQLDTLHRLVADQADPSVDTIAMCSQVTTFGVFEEMSTAQFVTGRATPTIVYSELNNLSAQKDADGRFRTELATRIEVFTAQGQSVLNREEPKIVDHCRRHRRDFFIAQRITLPATMQPGDYVLKVFVEDKIAGRAAEGSYPFTVGTRTASIRN